MGRPLICIPVRYQGGTHRTTLLSVCLLIILGCGDGPTEPGPIPIPIPPPPPEKCLMIMADAYERGDLARYETCLSDDFVHWFDPCDTCPPASGIRIEREDELECARKVFECSCVSRIEMELPIDRGPWATESGLGYRLDPDIRITIGEAEPAGTTSVSWAELKVLFAEDGITCEPRVYRVSSTYLYVEFSVHPADYEEWVLSEILEHRK